MHNDIGRCRGVMMIARWEAEVEDIEVGGGNYYQIWVASRVEGSKAKISKRFESGNRTLWSSFFMKTQKKTNVLSGVGALLNMVLVFITNGPYFSEKHY
jgi:hypothetical protein